MLHEDMTIDAADLPSAAERAWLVQLCASLTSGHGPAEDLAQDTLCQAWRLRHRLHDPTGRRAWLRAIARHTCLQWARDHGDRPPTRSAHSWPDQPSLDVEQVAADQPDIELALERTELIQLLDRALALLSPEVRAVLIERYVREQPPAQIAARLGVSSGAVKMRISRGKLALYGILTTQFREEAASYGLCDGEHANWQQTRIWCIFCGQSRLQGRFDRGRGHLVLTCPTCPRGAVSNFADSGPQPFLEQLKGFRPALTRLLRHAVAAFQQQVGGHLPCETCGRPLPIYTDRYDRVFFGLGQPLHFVGASCATCNYAISLPFAGLLLNRPEGARFWRAHPRLRIMPEPSLEVDGSPATRVRLESVTGSAYLEALYRCDTLTVLRTSMGGTAVS